MMNNDVKELIELLIDTKKKKPEDVDKLISKRLDELLENKGD